MANTEQYNKLEKRVEQLERKSCCPKIVFRGGGEFTEPGKEGILYVNTDNFNIYLWNELGYSYDSPNDGIQLFPPA